MKPNLLVIESDDIERLVRFYENLGFQFEYHRHGNGPMHYSSDHEGFVFEIYPNKSKGNNTVSFRFGLALQNVNNALESVEKLGGVIKTELNLGEYGLSAVINDPEGRSIELKEEGEYEYRGEFIINDTFLINNRGILLAGEIGLEYVLIGDFIELEFDKRKIIRRISGITIPNRPGNKIGIGIDTFEAEIEMIHKWKPNGTLARIIKKK